MSDNARHSRLPSTFRIAERIRNGESKPDMAAQCGVSVNTLNRHLRAAGWNGDGTPKPAESRGPRPPAAERALSDAPTLRIPEGVTLPCHAAPDVWFDVDGYHPEYIAGIKALCTPCPIRERCLEHAITHGEEFGIWGGFTAAEIAKVRSRRAKRKAAA